MCPVANVFVLFNLSYFRHSTSLSDFSSSSTSSSRLPVDHSFLAGIFVAQDNFANKLQDLTMGQVGVVDTDQAFDLAPEVGFRFGQVFQEQISCFPLALYRVCVCVNVPRISIHYYE